MNPGEGNKNAYVIAVGNQKGGCGKTANAVHLAAALGELGRKCLVMDLDANRGATMSLGIPDESYVGSFEVLIGVERPMDAVLTTDAEEGINLPDNFSLIPTRRLLEDIDRELLARNKFADHRDCLREPIKELRKHFDYIFLDTAPNISTPTIAAYKVADWIILSADPERLAIQGLNDAMTDVITVRQAGNPRLRLLGVILCKMQRRTRVSNELNEWVKDAFASAPGYGDFDTRISMATAVPKARTVGRTLFQEDPSHKVTEQYRALAREVEARLQEAAKEESEQDAPPVAEVGQGSVTNG